MAAPDEFREKRILITGASKGLGWVCATVLGARMARLVLAARSRDRLDRLRHSMPKPDDHMVFDGDLLIAAHITKLVEEAREFLGHFDVLLHVLGGGFGLRSPFLSCEEWSQLHHLNLGVAAEINRLVVPDMVERGRGNVVHVGSVASSEATGSVGYNTVKAALAGYVRSLGREVARSGVIVTGILPGAFVAPDNSWVRLGSQKPEAVEAFISERLPRKRIGNAEELIPLILLLCSDAASMMGGCMVPIDAGEGKAYVEP